MSTNSILARPTHDGGWEGRYCHWDCYPTHQARVLLELVAPTGDVGRTRRYLIDEHTGWSRLGGDWNQPTGYLARGNAPDITADPQGWSREQRRNQCYCHGDRRETDPLLRSADPLEVPWVCVLDHQALRVLYGQDRDRQRIPVEVARIPWDAQPTDAALLSVECGPELGRCQHIAAVHFPQLEGTPSGGLSTGKWLGRQALDFHDVQEMLIGGRRYTVHGGRLERRGNGYGERWFGFLRDQAPDGQLAELLIALLDDGRHQPAPGVTWLYPPTQAELETAGRSDPGAA